MNKRLIFLVNDLTYVVVEQSLTGLEDTLGELNARVESIETETRDMVRSQVLMPSPRSRNKNNFPL